MATVASSRDIVTRCMAQKASFCLMNLNTISLKRATSTCVIHDEVTVFVAYLTLCHGERE